MESFVKWLTELSPLTVYLVIGLSTFVENLLPPTPSDFLVTLGGFLAQRSAVSPFVVGLVAWLGYTTGSAMLYLLARRYGRGFVGSRLGKRLLPAEAIVALERAYVRFGRPGLFFGRFLPGFRSFLAPFLGLVGLPALRSLLPMALASAVWYAGLTWVGLRVGEEWEAINRFLGNLNRTLGIVAVIAAAALGFWIWRKRKTAGRHRRLLGVLSRAFPAENLETEGVPNVDVAEAGAAGLLFELTRGDPVLSLDERRAIAEYLRERWGVGDLRERDDHADLPLVTDTAELATIVSQRYDLMSRLAVAERLFRIALSDGALSRHEERLMRRIGDLLGLSADDLLTARKRVS